MSAVPQYEVTLLLVLSLTLLYACIVVGARRAVLRRGRPLLPAEDRAPAGLGRLVPHGAQVEKECRRGLDALELWLATSARRRGDGGAPLAG